MITVILAPHAFSQTQRVEREIGFFRQVFDETYEAGKAEFDRVALVGVGEAYYGFQYVLEATLSMFEATADIKYLEQVVNWAENMVSKATIVDTKGNRNWRGIWQSPYAREGIAFQLEDLQGATALARLCHIIVRDSRLRVAYGAKGEQICTFVKRDVIDKHLYQRGGEGWFLSDVSDKKHAMNDKAALMMRSLLFLYLSGEEGYRSIVHEMAQGFKARVEPYRGGLIWDLGRGFEGYSALDTSHGNRYPYAALDYHLAGVVLTDEDMAGIAALLTKVIWNGSMVDPRFTNFIDGANGPYRNLGPWAAGYIYSGWVTLAQVDRGVYEVGVATLDAMRAGVRNPSIISMNNSYGRLAMAGHLAKALTLRKWRR
jgi:hypothetical protein